MNEVESAECPHCDETVYDFGVMEIDREVVGEQIRTVGAVVCPECDTVTGTFSDYHRTDVTETDAETWERVRSIDE